MVDGGGAAAAETHVDGGDAGEVLEGGEVASGAHSGYVLVPEGANSLAGDGLVGAGDEVDCVVLVGGYVGREGWMKW